MNAKIEINDFLSIPSDTKNKTKIFDSFLVVETFNVFYTEKSSKSYNKI